jgi:hypothetical protein
MKHQLVLLTGLTFSLAATAAEKPRSKEVWFPAITDEPVLLQIHQSSVYAKGNWVALDEQSILPGPSVSEISCDRDQRICHENAANIVVVGDKFELDGADLDYKIARWSDSEVVAQNISGTCRTLNVLKFDLLRKRVYAYATLSEPVTNLPKITQDICNAVHMNLELRGASMYSTGRGVSPVIENPKKAP